MRNLLDFLARHNHWFVFVLLEVISAVLLFKYNSYQGSVWFSSANAVSGRVYEASAAVGQYFSLVTVNRQLTQRNVYLEREVARMAQEHAEATADSSYLQRLQNNQTNRYQSVPARVVSSSLDRLNNFITIDKGEADGVKKDMGVVCGTGMFTSPRPIIRWSSPCSIQSRTSVVPYVAVAILATCIGLVACPTRPTSTMFPDMHASALATLSLPVAIRRSFHRACSWAR